MKLLTENLSGDDLLADVNKQITEKIIAGLERGEIPWKKPWVAGFPRNILTGRPYNGINVFLLWNSRFASNWWGTEKQIQKLHGRLKADAEAHFVFFAGWKSRLLANNESGERINSTFGFTKLYRVFNADQCEGLKMPHPEGKSEDYARAAAIVNGYQHCRILTTQDMAAYHPGHDVIYMPPQNCFTSLEEYYVTLFHEMAHSTGHPDRLNRPGFAKAINGKPGYSKEELVAEMAACFLCAEAAINSDTGFANRVAYIDHWLSVLRKDDKILYRAASQAQKAANYILGRNEKSGSNDFS